MTSGGHQSDEEAATKPVEPSPEVAVTGPPDPLVRERSWLTVLRLGLPLAVGMGSHVLFNLVDLLLIGRLGQDAVAAAHVATALNFLPMILGNGVSVATISILARRLGGGDLEGARELSNRSQWWMLLLGALVGTVTALLAPPSIDAIGATGEVRREGIHYLVVSNLGCVTMYGLMQTTASMRALGDVWMPLALLVGANVLNLLLDVVLLFGWPGLGIDGLGVIGAAYATVLARAVGAVAGLLWLARRSCPLRLRWTGLGGRLAEGWRLLWLALPQMGQMAMRALAVIGLTRIAGDLAGNEAVAALGVTTRLDTMVLFGAIGFANAATTVTGRAVARGKVRQARAVAYWAAVQAFVFGAVLVLAFMLFARPLLLLFVPEASDGVLRHGTLYLAVAALGHPFGCFCLAASGAVNGAGRMVAPMVLDLLGYGLLLLPALLLAAYVAGAGLATVWTLFAAGNALLAVAYGVYVGLARWARPSPA